MLIIILCVVGIVWHNRTEQEVAVIRLNGEEIARVEWATLTEQVEIPVGDGNTVCADCEGVWMEWADCPDQLCVQQGKLRSGSLSIVCLPNRVTVTLTDRPEGMDGVAG